MQAEPVDAAMRGEISFGQSSSAFLRAFYMNWMSAAVQARPQLKSFDTLSHECTIEEFRELDQRTLRENRATLIGQRRDRTIQQLADEVGRWQLFAGAVESVLAQP